MTTAHPYDGPIEVGMRFLWEPFIPTATEHILVTRVEMNADAETWIWTRSWEPTSKVRGGFTGPELPNEESRFREAVMFVPA